MQCSLTYSFRLSLAIGLGAAYGTAKSGVGLSAMGVLRPDLLIKCIVPVVMAGILGIYGVVVSVLLSGGRKYSLYLHPVNSI